MNFKIADYFGTIKTILKKPSQNTILYKFCNLTIVTLLKTVIIIIVFCEGFNYMVLIDQIAKLDFKMGSD